jgi:hypothetical protein
MGTDCGRRGDEFDANGAAANYEDAFFETAAMTTPAATSSSMARASAAPAEDARRCDHGGRFRWIDSCACNVGAYIFRERSRSFFYHMSGEQRQQIMNKLEFLSSSRGRQQGAASDTVIAGYAAACHIEGESSCIMLRDCQYLYWSRPRRHRRRVRRPARHATRPRRGRRDG